MWVCICLGVSDNDIARLASEGASTLQDIQRETGLGTKCGKCRTLAEDILQKTSAAEHQQTNSVVRHWIPCKQDKRVQSGHNNLEA